MPEPYTEFVETNHLNAETDNESNEDDGLLNSVKDYADTLVKLSFTKLIKELSEIFSSVIGILVFVFLFFVGFLFSTIALSLWIGSLLDAPWLGFFWVGVGYFVLAIILVLSRKYILTPIFRNSFVKSVYDKYYKNL